ncbi:MAG: zinc-dependent peptidase [Pseudomonadota bacterium]
MDSGTNWTWLERWRRWRRARLLRRVMLPRSTWHRVVELSLARHHLSAAELGQLRELASLFLHEKTITGVDLVPTDLQRVTIAAFACLLILELDLSYYDGWYEVVLYPDTFVVRHQQVDDAGVVHEAASALGGESWQRGPVILSWADVTRGVAGYNVVLHEFAHKLDMASGVANGMPPLHEDMDHATWTRTFQQAFDRLRTEVAHHRSTWIDPYGAENPAEFFAVVSESFFETPHELQRFDTALYDQLRQFYQQDPALRMPETWHTHHDRQPHQRQ